MVPCPHPLPIAFTRNRTLTPLETGLAEVTQCGGQEATDSPVRSQRSPFNPSSTPTPRKTRIASPVHGGAACPWLIYSLTTPDNTRIRCGRLSEMCKTRYFSSLDRNLSFHTLIGCSPRSVCHCSTVRRERRATRFSLEPVP